MIFCKQLNKTFSNKSEMFKALKANKDQIIAAKKAEILKSCEKGLSITAKDISKVVKPNQIKGLEIDNDYFYLAVNTTRILDSHDDLHIDGLWNTTVSQRQGKNYLVADHQLNVANTIVRKEHIEMLLAMVPFSMIGKDYSGETQALIYKFRKDKVQNEQVGDWLESGDELQSSVRMQYVKMDLALNSTDPEDKTEKKEFDKYINTIANKDDFDCIDYFFTIKEAKNVQESSVVLYGSNPATGLIGGSEKGYYGQLKTELEKLTNLALLNADDSQKQKIESEAEQLSQMIDEFESTPSEKSTSEKPPKDTESNKSLINLIVKHL